MIATHTRKLALVTGGARGIGRHLCLRLAQSGYDILANYLSSDAEADLLTAEVTASGASALTWRADVSSAAVVVALFDAADATGRELGLVINNVGIYDPVPLRQIGSDQ